MKQLCHLYGTKIDVLCPFQWITNSSCIENTQESNGHNRNYQTGYRISTGWIYQKSLITSKQYVKIVLWVTYLTFRMIILFIYIRIKSTYIHVYRYECITHMHRYKHNYLHLYINIHIYLHIYRRKV